MAFKLTASPHISQGGLTSNVMLTVVLCTLPGFAAQWYFFGPGALLQLLLCVLFCIAGEALALAMRGRSIKAALSDNSALLTGVLLGLALPPYAPWWVAAIGGLFAVVMVKQLYGGLGHNLLNPAMAGYVLLLIAFPVQMTTWAAPQSLLGEPLSIAQAFSAVFAENAELVQMARASVDGITMATPLDSLKTSLTLGKTSSEAMQSPVFGQISGVGWEWVNLAYLLGGLVLLQRKVIRWHIPAGVLVGLWLTASISYSLLPDTTGTPWFHCFSGATMLAAFFIATDPVTAATSAKARFIFGMIIGVLVVIIRNFGGYPDAVAFAVLLANLCVPLLDYYVRPTTYGHTKGRS
ncbi:electron transport complex subunit RsxD [Paraferrimonas sedimenticola]|uniref:Ion-translocating oxidoreductase complex subunit D n=1 Tax=Paraferrimonas sedimenticola TaxID=375674 RepID=A0AA37W2J4_9GAMM|nr:electron transport complex subunit RsxD [Paraferrimonas sedimenticola]GLP97887.1 electron transport complex subunit D [Paraferrimonas sedimenticola]